MLHVARRALLVALLSLAVTPGVAQAWYVDISITGAGRVYETTDANEIDEHCEDLIEGFASPGITPTGTLGATCRAGDASGDYQHGWVVRYVAAPASGYRFHSWTSDGRSNPGPVLCDNSGSSPTYTGTGCQFQTFANLQVRANFVDDTNPQMSTLTGPNKVVNGAVTFTFSAAADPTFARFECRVGGVHEWQSCSSGHEVDPAASGTYVLQVRAVDHSGNRSAEMTKQWTVDKTMPETTLLTSGPNGLTNSRTAQFDFTSNEAGDFVCSLDGASFVTCGSGKTYTALADGPHTFRVAARDVAGNADPTPATRTFTVDTTAPETILSGAGPSGSTTSRTARFEFSSPDATATFRCSLDGAAHSPCSSPVDLSALAIGAHTFAVYAVDPATNQDASPAVRTWTVTDPPASNTGSGDTGDTGDTGGSGAPAGGLPQPVTVSKTSQPSGDSAADTGRPTITGRSRGTARLDRQGRFTIPGLRLTCPAVCTTSVRITAPKRRVLASTRVTPTRSGALRVRLSKKGLTAVKRAKRLRTTVVVTVTPTAGGAKATKTLTVTLSAPRR